MKIAVVLLVLMPLALSAAVDKRGILDFLGFGDGVVNLDTLKQMLESIRQKVGSDASEQACESACHDLMIVNEDNLLHTLCTPVCRSFQTLMNLFHIG